MTSEIPGHGGQPRVASRRTVMAIAIIALTLIIAGLALAVRAGSPPASPLVVQGRVTSPAGKPVSGVKVWLNALHDHQLTGEVTVVTWTATSATGNYVLRVTPSAALAANADHGVVHFVLMTGDSAGVAHPRFFRRLAQSTAGAPVGGVVTVNLHLMPQ